VSKKKLTNYQIFLTANTKIWCEVCVKVSSPKYEKRKLRILLNKTYKIMKTLKFCIFSTKMVENRYVRVYSIKIRVISLSLSY